MKIFLDTANIDQIKKAVEWGIVDGVTTNPTLVSKENAVFEERIVEICNTVKGPVSAEVTAMDYEGMVSQAQKLAKLSDYVVVKIPMTTDGIRTTKKLTALGIKTNVTLAFSPLQALLAAKAGATYVSPFVGRYDDIGQIGMDIVRQVIDIYLNYGYKTEIIVASIRHPEHVLEAALAGAHIGTMPYAVLEKMFNHPLTDIGIASFEKDWQKYQEYLNSRK